MPKVKDIGLGKHLKEYDERKQREQREREKRNKIVKKTAEYKAKTKLNKAKKSYATSKKGRRKTAGSGVSLKRLFGK
jgi:hypothetical protein